MVSHGSILEPLLFLIYINDLHLAIKNITVRHYADDTKLITSNKSAKTLTRKLNLDLKILSKWLRANKISLNAKKTELIIFRSKQKVINYDIKIKLDGKMLIPTNFVKYIGLYIDCHLDWSFHTKILSSKLSRAVGLLSKIRHYVNKKTLHSLYYAIFSSQMDYASIIWGQKPTLHINRIQTAQNKAVSLKFCAL